MIFDTKPSNTFYMAFKKLLHGFVKNGGKPSKIKINQKYLVLPK